MVNHSKLKKKSSSHSFSSIVPLFFFQIKCFNTILVVYFVLPFTEELAARSCDSLSSDSQSIQKPLAETQSIQKPLAETPSDKEPIANTPNDQETLAETPSAVEETQPKPVKKTVAELTRKNVLISGLLKRKREYTGTYLKLMLCYESNDPDQTLKVD